MKNLSLFIFVLSLGLTACEEGPAERLGKDIDRAASNVGNAVEDACEGVTNEPC